MMNTPTSFHFDRLSALRVALSAALVILCISFAHSQSGLRIALSSPTLGPDSTISTEADRITVSGRVFSTAPLMILKVGKKDVPWGADGSFERTMELVPGKNVITIGAADKVRNTGKMVFVVMRNAPLAATPVDMLTPEAMAPATDPPIALVAPAVPMSIPTQDPAPKPAPQPYTGDGEEDEPLPTIHALIIGISQYRNDQRINLNYAAKDALAFYDFITSERGLNADPANVILLRDQDATRMAILTSLKDLMNRARTDDVFLLYFSGHGEAVGNSREFCFFTHDAITGNVDQLEASAVLQSELMHRIRDAKPQKKLLFLDACYSGIMASSGSKGVSEHHEPLMRMMAETDKTLTILTSSSDNEKSYEDPDLAGGHGIFTYYLVKGLQGDADRGRDGDSNGYVTVYELDRYVADEVDSRARLIFKQPQRPKKLCDNCDDFPLNRTSSYNIDTAVPAVVAADTRTTAPAPTRPTETPVQPITSPTGRNYEAFRLPPSPKEIYTLPENPKVLSEVVYGNDATGDKITFYGQHYTDVYVSGILGGMVINGKGKILGDMIAFTDADAHQKLNESYLNLTTEWDGLKAMINFTDGHKVIHQLVRRGVAKREVLYQRRFVSTDGRIGLCVYHHHYSDIKVSGHVQGMIMDAAGTQKGDVLEFNDNKKGAYMAGRFVVSDDWTSMRGTITYEDGSTVEVELPASRVDTGYELNDSRYANTSNDQTISFFGAHYAKIELSGIVGEENIVCVGEVHGDVIVVNFEEENARFLPSRLVLRDEGKLLEGSIIFKPDSGVKVNMTRTK